MDAPASSGRGSTLASRDATLSALVRARLVELGTPERAAGEKRYLKSDLEHLGVRLPVLRRTVREVLRDRSLALSERLALATELWGHHVFDMRQAAVEVLQRSRDELDTSHLSLLERLLREARTWALVDPLSTDVVGSIARRHPDARVILDRWITDDDFWIRRAALLTYLRPLRERPDRAAFEAFAAYADDVLDEREFFIRKAIGWVLREAGKRNAQLVTDWLAPRTHRASGVTMREAVKYLPQDDAESLMDAYRARRPATRRPREVRSGVRD